MERDEVNDLITAKTAGSLARIEAAVNLVAVKVGYIEEHMKEANSKTAANVLKIEEIRQQVMELERTLPHSPINCPQNATLKEIKEFIDQAKNRKEAEDDITDSVIKTRGEKRAEVLKRIAYVSVVVAAMALVLNLTISVVGFFQKRQIKQEVETIMPVKK